MPVRGDTERTLTYGPMNRNLTNSNIETAHMFETNPIYSKRVYDSFSGFGGFRCVIEDDYIFPKEKSGRKTPKFQHPKNPIDLEDIDSIIQWFKQFRIIADRYELTYKECRNAIYFSTVGESTQLTEELQSENFTCLLHLMLVLVQINFPMETSGLYKIDLMERRNYPTSKLGFRKTFIDGCNRYYIISLANNQENTVGLTDCLDIFILCFGLEKVKAFQVNYPNYRRFSVNEMVNKLCGKSSAVLEKLATEYTEPSPQVVAVEGGKKEKTVVHCYCCGAKGHIKSNCRHQKNICQNCGKKRHFSAVCRGLAIRDKKGNLRAITTYKSNAVVEETLNTDTCRHIVSQIMDLLDKLERDMDKIKE